SERLRRRHRRSENGESCEPPGTGQCFYGSKLCLLIAGSGYSGHCEGEAPCFEGDELDCRVPGSCVDEPIDPLPLCCQIASGGCYDTVATTAGAIGACDCGGLELPEQGVCVATAAAAPAAAVATRTRQT